MAAARKSQHATEGSELLGQLAGEYRILRKLGAGGFGTVYEAEHPLLRRRAAVKVLHAQPAVDSVAVQRFIEEARSASQIRHHNIVDIFSFGTLPNGQYFYVMDLLDGAPLDRYLKEHGRLTPELALPLLRPIANAIDALHAAALVHRDLKPANVYLAWDASGELIPKVLDFGLVKLLGKTSVHTSTGAPLGTPFYMSPEQCQGAALDARADIYSFGVICFEVLTGKVPFEGESATSVLVAHVLTPPPRPSEVCPQLARELDEPVLQMLAKEPAARPATATAAVRQLQLAAQSAGITIADRAPWLPRPAAPASEAAAGDGPNVTRSGTRDGVRRVPPEGRRVVVWAVAGVLVVGLGVTSVLLRPRAAPGDPAERVEPVRPTAAVAPVAPPARNSPPHGAAGAGPSAPGFATGAIAASEPAPTPRAQPGSSAQPAAAAEVEAVPISVAGAPEGAEIWLGPRLLGTAPGPVLVPFGEQPVRLTVVVSGRRRRTLRVTPDAPGTVRLPAARPREARPPLPEDLEDPF